MMEMVIHVLVVDDHPIVRTGLKAVLANDPDLLVIGEASDGVEAVQLVESLRPHVVLMDIQMPRLNGVEAVRQIMAKNHEIKVIILTTYDDDDLIWSGLQAGAKGYLLKDTPPEELFHAIKTVAHGGSLLPPTVAAKLIAHINKPKPNQEEILTEREMEILKLMAKGSANKAIACELSISENTVKTHISNIFQKLGVNDRTEAVTKALSGGIITL